MNFNVDICEVLHIDSNNDHSNNSMKGSEVVMVNEKKNLGIIIISYFKSSKYCSKVVKRHINWLALLIELLN